MAKFIQVSFLFVVALCFLSFPSVIYSEDVPQPPVSQFHIQGQVYCDTCRAGFITELSEFIPGASLRLQCKDKENGDVTFTEVGYTRAEGLYSMLVERDHKNEFCEITLISSGRKDCNEIPTEGWVKPSLKFILNTVNGTTRTVNPLGFFKKEALPKCAQVYNKLGMYPPNM
ncbi:major pollen allergen Ole e 1 [Olea europaea var. sylvestris]|uniref:Major pollen allergen Ole e 1-like n=1 Tax=Olea europaea subsp. europaea TaxID=158383 RepID=A0A8S0RT50_OLEEU|nr:major pollen allergen Ole e 1 [Olea europaea var. sylvestris]CAA2982520.1 major pollen allergen Ole e 1-like [Olea europaea subsp. europaea]